MRTLHFLSYGDRPDLCRHVAEKWRINMDNRYIAKPNDIIEAANEITIHSYRMGKTNMEKIFRNINPLDYEIISVLAKKSSSADGQDKFYLSDISEKIQIPIGKVSKIVRLLDERHFVKWQHDGDGNEGTYIQITEKGLEAVKQQQEKLRDFYTNIINKFGRERFLAHLHEMIELDNIMQNEIKKYEDE